MPDMLDKSVIGTSVASGIATTASSIITGLGFTSSGIVASSTAAGIQAGIGNVAAGSLFAGLQSLAATGVVATVGIFGGVGLGVGAVYGGYKGYQYLKNKRQTPKL
jgi:hypothetical protein